MKFGWVSYFRSVFCAAGLALAGLVNAHALPAQGFMGFVPPSTQKTHLIGIQQGSALSRTVSNVRSEIVELSDGTPFFLRNKYKTNWQDLQLTFLTEINPNLGLIFGFGTGERGPNYKIEPSFELGFVHLTQFDKKTTCKSGLAKDLREDSRKSLVLLLDQT